MTPEERRKISAGNAAKATAARRKMLDSPDLTKLSAAACARALGITDVRLYNLHRDGRIPRNEDGSWHLDKVRAACTETLDKRQGSKVLNTASPYSGKAAPATAASQPPDTPLEVTGDPDDYTHPNGELNFNKIRTKHELLKLKTTELELSEREGTLVDSERVKHEWGAMVLSVQSRFLLLPAKLAPRLAVITDVREIQAAIDKEVRLALTELSIKEEDEAKDAA